ncbi:1,4-dihydroxy-2-naphthoate polyprenyltransferase [Thermophagus sp. OGC60D27]|uniref:1,4-dihydroxy-2-naphthoate polyprenyltransferase n=1 Tax=Thermophagus sp. OGC60D27 TaxID=3458415 RepID=UPI004037FB3B
MTFNIRAWIVSLRLRTLPLALSTIFMGSLLASGQGCFKLSVLVWASLTTLFLQILSNLANDYGDAVSGADNAERQGPQRMIQQGVITLRQMKRAIIFTSVLALISGVTLIFNALKDQLMVLLLFFFLGISALVAAIRYTVGKNPYGYRGLGDFFVFVFFGLLGVGGTYYLHAGIWNWSVLLPAFSIGAFSTGVLNLNNIRDIQSDDKSGKKTLPVMMGRKMAAFYHLALLLLGWGAFIVWLLNYEQANTGAWLVILAFPLFVFNAIAVFRFKAPLAGLDKQLRNLSLGTLLMVVLYGIGSFLI